MHLDICPLTPTLLDDYLNFFNNIAFSDNPTAPKCHCVHFHWNAEFEAEFHRSGKVGDAADFVNRGVIKGYLVYKDGNVVGWCNANDKRNFDGLRCDVLKGNRRELWNDAVNDIKIKSVVCFLVAPSMRGQGVARQLLERVCKDAKNEGYNCVEGYPLVMETNTYANHHGPMKLFSKLGFNEYKRYKNDAIMRLYLTEEK